jgi:hypothetical protein
MGEVRNAYRIFVDNLKERDHLGDIDEDIIKMYLNGKGLDMNCILVVAGGVPVEGSCENDNANSGSTKGSICLYS